MKHQTNYLYGIHAISALIEKRPEQINRLIIANERHDERVQRLLKLADKAGLKVTKQNKQALQDLVGEVNHQGVIAESKPAMPGSEGDLQAWLDAQEQPLLILVLDGLQDPHNLGACLRSADAFGVDAVIIPKDKAVGLNATVAKVACGAAELLTIFQVTNLARVLKALQEHGVWLYGAAGEATQSLYAIDFSKQSSAIVLGAEGKGLRRLTRDNCDELFAIPMQGGVESLNVSVACGVSLAEVRRQILHK